MASILDEDRTCEILARLGRSSRAIAEGTPEDTSARQLLVYSLLCQIFVDRNPWLGPRPKLRLPQNALFQFSVLVDPNLKMTVNEALNIHCGKIRGRQQIGFPTACTPG